MGFETVFFAIVAFLVLGRLFQVLGQNHGAPPPIAKDFRSENGPEMNAPLNRGIPTENENKGSDENPIISEANIAFDSVENRFSAMRDEIKKIRSHEANFNPINFERTAALAFEAIVTAFGKGDEATLRNLTNEKVYAAYQEGIKQRRDSNKGAIDIVKLNEPLIKAIEISQQNRQEIASIDVEFNATLTGEGEKTRNTNEIWTFEKTLGDKSPIWRLSAVRSA